MAADTQTTQTPETQTQDQEHRVTDLERLMAKPATFGRDMQITDLDEAIRFAQLIVDSGFAPKGMTVPGAVVAIQMGYEVGLSPMQAVQNIAPINNRPTMWGDALLGLVRASGKLEYIREEYVGEPGGDDRGCRVTVKRRGQEEASETFTVADAKRANLWGKQGPWREYPQRMLKFRARAFLLRDQFGDVLKGLACREEVMDFPARETVQQEPTPEAEAAKAAIFGAPAPDETPAPQSAAPAEPEPQKSEEPAPTPADLVQALAAKRLPVAMLEDYLRSRGKLAEGRTYKDLPQKSVQAIVRNIDQVVRDVSAWADSREG